MLQACLNGDRDRRFHAAISLTPLELAADAKAVAGAQQLHVHPRDADGRESLDPDDTARALDAIRASVPGIAVGVSTGWWIAPRGRARQQHIRAWQVLPDYVSINLIEEDAPEIIDLVLGKGIGVEAGLWSATDAERFVADRNARHCLRVLIEINEQEFSAGLQVAREIIEILDRAEIRLPRLLHGFEKQDVDVLSRSISPRARYPDRVRGRQVPPVRSRSHGQCRTDPRGARLAAPGCVSITLKTTRTKTQGVRRCSPDAVSCWPPWQPE
jgi:uncharacterized protein (DUF849 family)